MLVEVPFITIIAQLMMLAKLYEGYKMPIAAFGVLVMLCMPIIVSIIREHPHRVRIVLCNFIVIGAMCVPYATVLGIAGWCTLIAWSTAGRELLQDV